MRVLIVNTEHQAGVLLSRIIEERGDESRVVEGESGMLESIAASEPDVVMLDCGQLGMRAPEFLAEIRRHARAVPLVVAILDVAFEDESAVALNAGFDDYLLKPVSARPVKRVLYLAQIRRGAVAPANIAQVHPRGSSPDFRGRRNHVRFGLESEVFVTLSYEGGLHRARVRNISACGMLASLSLALTQNAVVQLATPKAEGTGELVVSASIAWSTRDLHGLCFESGQADAPRFFWAVRDWDAIASRRQVA